MQKIILKECTIPITGNSQKKFLLITEITTTFRDFVKITFEVLDIKVEFKSNRFNKVGHIKIPSVSNSSKKIKLD